MVGNPDLALDPAISAKILGWYMASGDHDTRIETALSKGDFASARKVVNGGTNGLSKFKASYKIGEALLREQNGQTTNT